MGIGNDIKETLNAVGEKVKRQVHDRKDQLGDKLDEHEARANEKKATAERESVETRNEIKDELRDT